MKSGSNFRRLQQSAEFPEPKREHSRETASEAPAMYQGHSQ